MTIFLSVSALRGKLFGSMATVHIAYVEKDPFPSKNSIRQTCFMCPRADAVFVEPPLSSVFLIVSACVQSTTVECRVGPGIAPGPLTEPDVSLSTYPARATQWRLPPPVENRRVPP